MSKTSKSMPASLAIAGRCSNPLVDPPVAATTAAAFSSALRVTMSRGRRLSLSRRITASPVWNAKASRSAITAGAADEPGSARPIASDTQAMVLAVNWPPQAPADGHAIFSSAVSSSSGIWPDWYLPTAS